MTQTAYVTITLKSNWAPALKCTQNLLYLLQGAGGPLRPSLRWLDDELHIASTLLLDLH